MFFFRVFNYCLWVSINMQGIYRVLVNLVTYLWILLSVIFKYHRQHTYVILLSITLPNEISPRGLRPTSGGVVLRSKLVDGRCRVQFPVALVELAVLEFSLFFLRNSHKYRVRSLRKIPIEGILMKSQVPSCDNRT